MVLVPVLVTACGGSEPSTPTEPDPTPPPVVAAEVRLTPDSAQVVVGNSVTLSASVIDTKGATSSAFPVSWSSSTPTVVTSSGNGTFVAVAPGLAVVVATAQGGVSATARIRVVDVAVSADVVMADSAFTVLSDSAEIASGTLRMQATGTGSQVAVGDVVFGTTDGGFLEKVTAVQSAGGQVVLSTVPARLTDAIKEGSIDVSGNLDISAELAQARLRTGSNAIQLPPGVSIDHRGRVLFSNANLIFESSGSIQGLAASVKLTGAINVRSGSELKAGADSWRLKVDVSPCFSSVVCLDKVDFGTVVGVELDGAIESEVAITAGGRLAIPLKIPMGKKRIANIPLRGQCFASRMLCVGLFAVLEVYAEASASAQLSVTRPINVKSGVDAGFTWTESQGFKGHFLPINSFTQGNTSYSIGGEAGVRLGMEAKLLLTVFGRGELSGGVDAAVAASVSASSNYLWETEVLALLDAFMRAEVDVLGFNATWEPVRARIWDHVIDASSGPLAKLSLTPSPVAVEVGQQATVTPHASTILGNFHIGITPQGVDWSVSPAHIASVNSSGVVTGLQAGTGMVTGTIKGTTISAQVPLTVTQPGLQLYGCFRFDQPTGGRCLVQESQTYKRGELVRYLWVQVAPPGQPTVSGYSVTVLNPFTGAVLTPVTVNNHSRYEFTVPANQAPGTYNVVVGPASKAGYANAAPINVPFEVVFGTVGVGGCLTSDATTAFNYNLHCVAPTGSCPIDDSPTCTNFQLNGGVAGQTYYLWFGGDDEDHVAMCGVTVSVKNPFTGATTDYLVPQGTPLCLLRVPVTVPPGTGPGSYNFEIGPARLPNWAPTPIKKTLTLVIP